MVQKGAATSGKVILLEHGDLESCLGQSRGRRDSSSSSSCNTICQRLVFVGGDGSDTHLRRWPSFGEWCRSWLDSRIDLPTAKGLASDSKRLHDVKQIMSKHSSWRFAVQLRTRPHRPSTISWFASNPTITLRPERSTIAYQNCITIHDSHSILIRPPQRD